MKRKALITIFFLLLLVFKSFSKEINLPFDLKINVPESIIQDTTSQYLFLGYDSTFSVYVATVETSDFYAGEVLRTLEQYSYNLKNVHCYKEEKDKFYEWNKDYVKKYYKGNDLTLLTYTFYTADRPYSILIGYKGEDGEKEAEAVIQSICYKGNLWKQICLTYKRATIFWWLFYLLIYPAICFCVVCCTDTNNKKDFKMKKPYIISVLCTLPIMLITLWGSWINAFCYMLINIVATIPCFLLAMVGLLSLFKDDDKSNNDKFSDFDGGYDGGYDGGDYKSEYAEIVGL